MNRILALAVCAAAIAAAAESSVTPAGPPEGGTPVASPNRTTSAQLVRANSVGVGVGVGSTTAAPVWVDPTGVVGRAYSVQCRFQSSAGCVALTQYNDKPLGIKLWQDLGYDANNNPTGPQSAGLSMNAPSSGFVYYTSSDCSGPAYLPQDSAYAGFPQVGVSIHDSSGGKDGKDYIYISDQTNLGTQPISIGSSFFNGQCYVFGSPFQYVAFPVIAVVPSSRFAAAGAIWIK